FLGEQPGGVFQIAHEIHANDSSACICADEAFLVAAVLSETMHPSNISILRSVFIARCGSCVTMQMVAPSECSLSNSCITVSAFFVSRFPVGSSASRIEGLPAMAL